MIVPPTPDPALPCPPALFRSFWMGGYESATHITNAGERLDMIAGVQHDSQVEHDYALLKSVGILAARDGLRWHLIDQGDGRYDWSSFEPMFLAAARQGIQVVWDVCHYGWPDGLDVFSAEFVSRFARFSRAVATWVRERSDEIPFYAPMNEINFLAWGASRFFMYPFAEGRDNELKRQLVRATIAGCREILDVDPRARLVFPEPLIQVLPPRHRPDLAETARRETDAQFEAWDMIAGFASPELGGNPKILDILGANFYHSNEWEIEGNGRLRWEDQPRDDRWVPLHELLARVYKRYKRPLFLAETSHVGIGRGPWISEVADEVLQARQSGVPVAAVCLYPITDRFDWQDRSHWHNSGLWDFSFEYGTMTRVLNRDYALSFTKAQLKLASVGCV